MDLRTEKERITVAAERLKEKREEAKFTLRNLAKKMDYSHNYLYDIERGNRKPSREFVERFFEAIDLTGKEREEILGLLDMTVDRNLTEEQKELMQLLKETEIVVGAYSGKLSPQSVKLLIKSIREWKNNVRDK